MKKLGKFEILERVGQGAMGVVYKARDPLIGRLVALKTITTGLAEDPALLERFYHEAHSAGALQHPNIVTIYELGEEDHTPFIAMEYLTGQSLDKVIEGRQKLPLSQRIGYISYVCRALAYAHKQGVVHRDIKPANVMVTSEGTVKVVDFGIARIAENSKSQTGLVIGTLGYMSPQQIEGGRADARSDVWAAGILFYELLAYRRPFDGENYGALMLNIMKQELPPLSETAPGTPPDVAEVVDLMLRREIDERYQSMAEVLIDLEPVWRRLQHAEMADSLAGIREMLEVGDVGKAYEMVRRVLQIDTANAPAKALLEQINAEMRRNQTLPPPPVEKNPQDDETLIGPALGAIRSSLPSVPPPTASRVRKVSTQSGSAGDTVNRVRAPETRRDVAVQPEVPSPAPAHAAVPKWKQPVPIALLVIAVVIIAGGGTYFLGLRRQDTPVPGTPVATTAPVSSAPSSPGLSNGVPAALGAASGNAASPDADKQPQPLTDNSVKANSTVRTVSNFPDANAPNRVTPVPQQPPKDQGGTGAGATPSPSSRAEVAANNPVPAPAAVSPQPVVQPSQPPTITPQPAAQPSQPPAASAAPVPAAKAADPAPASPAAAPPVASSSSSDSLDQQQIKLELQQLSAAFSDRSLSELDAIWPKNSDRNTYKKAFSAAKAMTREFHTQNVTISNDGATATAVGAYAGMVNIGAGNTPISGNFYVRFGKKNGRWYIDDANF